MSTPPALEQRRATVRHLKAAGHSNRAIARQLGISKDAVARDLRATEPDPSEPGEPHDAPPALPAETVARPASETLALSSNNPPAPQLLFQLHPRLIQTLNLLTDPHTGRLPAPLERSLHIAAAARLAAWCDSRPRQPSHDHATASQDST